MATFLSLYSTAWNVLEEGRIVAIIIYINHKIKPFITIYGEIKVIIAIYAIYILSYYENYILSYYVNFILSYYANNILLYYVNCILYYFNNIIS